MTTRCTRRTFLQAGAACAVAPLCARAQDKALWPFFAFDNGVGRGKWEPEKQAATLKALGYDGISYNYTNNKDLETWVRVYREAGLKIYGLYFPVAPAKKPAWNPALREAIALLKGSETALWVTVPAAKDKAADAYDADAARELRELADLAQQSGLRVVLYPHAGNHVATALDSQRVAKKAAHPAVKPSYNLCHEFMTGNGAQALETLRAVAGEIALFSLNGVEPTDKKRYILPLGQGGFDTAALLAELKRLGYKGPVGHQFYSIPGDIETNLKDAIAAWRKQQPA
jgi:sugar phosphate isomerase/epimerase